MISTNRVKKAAEQGKIASIATRGNPRLTMNPYPLYSAQNRSFSKEFSQTANRFREIWAKSQTATKTD